MTDITLDEQIRHCESEIEFFSETHVPDGYYDKEIKIYKAIAESLRALQWIPVEDIHNIINRYKATDNPVTQSTYKNMIMNKLLENHE